MPYNFEWLPFTADLHINMGILLDPISIMMLVVISTVSLMVHMGTAPESYVLYARLVQSRFTLVKYSTHFAVKQLTFVQKRPLLSIVLNISIDYFDLPFCFF